MTCFACDREPTQQCTRCGRPYCEEHGEELCDACMSPQSGIPSFTLYRGSLFALLIGGVLAVYLLILEPTGGSTEGLKPVVITPTTVAQQQQQTPAAGNTQPAGNATPITTRPAGTPTTPTTGTTPSSTATGPTGTTEYTVVSGDTLTDICVKVKPASMTVGDCVDRVRALNNLRSDEISVGQKLIVPK